VDCVEACPALGIIVVSRSLAFTVFSIDTGELMYTVDLAEAEHRGVLSCGTCPSLAFTDEGNATPHLLLAAVCKNPSSPLTDIAVFDLSTPGTFTLLGHLDLGLFDATAVATKGTRAAVCCSPRRPEGPVAVRLYEGSGATWRLTGCVGSETTGLRALHDRPITMAVDVWFAAGGDALTIHYAHHSEPEDRAFTSVLATFDTSPPGSVHTETGESPSPVARDVTSLSIGYTSVKPTRDGLLLLPRFHGGAVLRTVAGEEVPIPVRTAFKCRPCFCKAAVLPDGRIAVADSGRLGYVGLFDPPSHGAAAAGKP